MGQQDKVAKRIIRKKAAEYTKRIDQLAQQARNIDAQIQQLNQNKNQVVTEIVKLQGSKNALEDLCGNADKSTPINVVKDEDEEEEES